MDFKKMGISPWLVLNYSRAFILHIYQKIKASRAEDLLEEIQQLKVIKEKICLIASFVADGHSINKKFARLYLRKISHRAIFVICLMHMIGRVIEKIKATVPNLKKVVD